MGINTTADLRESISVFRGVALRTNHEAEYQKVRVHCLLGEVLGLDLLGDLRATMEILGFAHCAVWLRYCRRWA